MKGYTLHHGNNLEILKAMAEAGTMVDAVVTDPPYGLSTGQDTAYNVLRILSEIVFPDLDELQSKSSDQCSFPSIPITIMNLDMVDRTIGIKSRVTMPKCTVDLDGQRVRGNHKIDNSGKSSERVSDNELRNESDAELGQFLGDYLLDLRDAWNFSSVNGFASSFAEFSSSGFCVPVVPVFNSSCPSPLARLASIVLRDQLVRSSDNTFGQSESHSLPLTFERAVNGFVLRFDLSRGTIELDTTYTARNCDSAFLSVTPKLVAAHTATSGLSSEFQPYLIRCVMGGANGALAGYFRIWIHRKWQQKLTSIYASSGFMGKQWDSTVPSVEFWRHIYKVLKPGGHVLSFGGTRTYHRMVVNLEDAGFEIRDQIAWLYGSGFPKSMNVALAIDKAARGVPQGGADPTSPSHGKYKGGCSEENEAGQGFGAGPGQFMAEDGEKNARSELHETAEPWDGWGTALKPAMEPVVVARKPIEEKTVASNVLKHGTGAINIDACRVPYESGGNLASNPSLRTHINGGNGGNIFPTEEARRVVTPNMEGRFPANVILDGVAGDMLDDQTGVLKSGVAIEPVGKVKSNTIYGKTNTLGRECGYDDAGGASRFFYRVQEDGQGRFPANVILDEESGAALDDQTGILKSGARTGKRNQPKTKNAYGKFELRDEAPSEGSEGGASRFFYCAKASKRERAGSKHPTIKPVDLMRYLVRLVTPPGGTILDPYAGTGTTGVAALLEGFEPILIEREPDYVADIKKRLETTLEGCKAGASIDDLFEAA